MNITVVGAGYVGMSLATLLSQKHNVTIIDVVSSKIDKINSQISPIKDVLIEDFLRNKQLNLFGTIDSNIAYKNAEFIIIATPTNYNEETNYFDVSTIENVIENILKYSSNKLKAIIIKSTIPIGYTNALRKKFNLNNILFSPEFLREGKALEDNLSPSRIIIGFNEDDSELLKNSANEFVNILNDCTLDKNSKIIFTGLEEAESIKLFANTYLAMRVAFFNELDTFASKNNLNTKDIIEGISSDSRIGFGYNNPSFGYGGYCLPKDTKQLLSNFNKKNIPQNLISSIVESNKTRKEFIVNDIISKNFSTIGIYKLAMKANSDNSRSSAILDIINLIQEKSSVKIIIYDNENIFSNFDYCTKFDEFISKSDIILTNRIDDKIKPFINKVYTKDIYQTN